MERRVLENLAQNLLNDTFNFSELEKSISLLLLNEYPLLNEAKALTPNIIPVGGMHIRKVEEMPGVSTYTFEHLLIKLQESNLDSKE